MLTFASSEFMKKKPSVYMAVRFMLEYNTPPPPQ